MPLDVEALTGALGALAEQDAPPSRVDTDRARADGRRTLRRRRAAAGLGTSGAVALIAVLAVTIGPASGGPQAAGGVTAQATHTADWDPLVAPGTFGWLPANAQNVNYSVAPGPGQGSQALGKGSQVSNGTVGSDPAMIWLSVLDPAKPAPKAGPVSDGSNRILIPAPQVNNRPAFWEVDPAERSPDLGKAGVLYFQSPTGRWAEINAYYLGADPVVDTLLHVAKTAHIGDIEVPMPVQISGLPAVVTAPVASLDRPSTLPGAGWDAGVSFDLGGANSLIHIDVAPANTATVNALFSGANHCKTSNGLVICVSAVDQPNPKLPPGGLDGLLRNITSLGTNPAHWTTDVVVAP